MQIQKGGGGGGGGQGCEVMPSQTVSKIRATVNFLSSSTNYKHNMTNRKFTFWFANSCIHIDNK